MRYCTYRIIIPNPFARLRTEWGKLPVRTGPDASEAGSLCRI